MRWEEATRRWRIIEIFELWQHQRLKKLVQEEVADLLAGKPTEGWAQQWVKESVDMEKVMGTKARIKAMATPEVLQTRTVPLEEVKKDLEKWRAAFEKEYETLTAGPVEVLDRQQCQRLKDSGVEIETLPMKAVTVQKPDKLKARFVVCGNMAADPGPGEETDNSVGGACTVAVRCLVHKAALESWSLGTIDVAAAFLQAPRRGDKVTLVEPPAVLKLLGLSKPGDCWRVRCALYGFMQSPADWAHFRDNSLEGLRWKGSQGLCEVRRTAEPHVWELWQLEEKTEKKGTTIGYMTVYVDDILVATDKKEMSGFFAALKALWRCSEEEVVMEDKGIRFCGYEIRADGREGYYLSQEHYLKDVLRRRGVEGKEWIPIPKVQDTEDEEMCGEALKEAQGVIGEAMWVAGRTRPDVAYATGLLARLMHRRPRYTLKMAEHLLKYLNGTTTRCLHYPKPMEDAGLGKMTVATDASFAPEHEKFRSITGLIISHGSSTLQWLSTRQPFVTQSTCEAELIGFSEGYQAGESTAALLEIFNVRVKRELIGDNKAALAQVLGDTGPWRTRHLRIRAAKVREALREEDASWSASHKEGALLVADGATKPLQGAAFRLFVERLNMEDQEKPCEEQKKMEPKMNKIQEKKGLTANLLHEGGTALLGGGAALMCTEKHRGLGAMLLLCGLCVKGWEVSQDRNKNEEDRKKDSEKNQGMEPIGESGSGTAIKKMGVTGITQQGQQVVKGEEKGEKNRQDPERTTEKETHGSNGSATLKGNGRIREVPHRHPSQNGTQDGSLGGGKPGIRAIRNVRKEGRSHGDDTSRSAAAASGSTGADGDEGPVSFGERHTGPKARAAAVGPIAAGGAAINASGDSGSGGYTKDLPKVRVKTDVTSQGEPYHVSVDVMVEAMTGDASQTPVPPSTQSKGGVQEKEECFTGGAQEREECFTGGVPKGDGRRERDGRREGDGRFEGQQPWLEPRFMMAPSRASDIWEMRYVEQGWLLRVHGKPRKRRFHPVHGSVPVTPDKLGDGRITIRFLEDGTADHYSDDWRGLVRTDDNQKWRGYTFIQILQSGSSHAGEPVGYEEAKGSTSDGSYEMVPS